MKKIVVMLVTMMFVAGSAMAMETISDGQMDQITGQAGVSIAVDDVKLYQNIQGLWYTDDGLTTSDAGASVGIQSLEMMVNVNAYTGVNTAGDALVSIGRALQGDYGDSFDFYNNDANDAFEAKPITIDVTSALPALTAGATYNAGGAAPVAGVNIGLGTMEVVQSSMSITIGITDTDPLDLTDSGDTLVSANAGADYGTINIGSVTMGVLDGSIEIAPH